MAKWTNLATWKGPTSNQGGAMSEYRGLVIHIAEGYLDGTLSWQKNPSSDVSSHFIVGGPRDGASKDGVCYQVVETNVVAWTQGSGNGHWLSIECSGFTPDKLSAKQIEKIAQIFARCHTDLGVPLQLANSPSGKGLGHHSMGCNQGWGHCDCPGNNIINQKQQILDRAIEIVGGDVALTDSDVEKIWAYQFSSSALGFSNVAARDWLKGAREATLKISNVGAPEGIAEDTTILYLVKQLITKVDELSAKVDEITSGDVDPAVAAALRAGADAIDPVTP